MGVCSDSGNCLQLRTIGFLSKLKPKSLLYVNAAGKFDGLSLLATSIQRIALARR